MKRIQHLSKDSLDVAVLSLSYLKLNFRNAHSRKALFKISATVSLVFHAYRILRDFKTLREL